MARYTLLRGRVGGKSGVWARPALVAAVLACSGAVAQTPEPELKYAVILTRHGVRAPTWTRERLNQYSTSPWPDWGVPPGHLTVHGRALMKIMGTYYREYFTARGLLSDGDCADARRSSFWADSDQRTIETARALAETMLPGCPTEVHPLPEPESAAGVPDSSLLQASVRGRIGPSPEVALVDAHRAAFDALAMVLNGRGKAARSIYDEPFSLKAEGGEVTMGGPLRLASTFTENFLLEYTNGMSGDQLGWGRLNRGNLLQMMSLHTAYAELMRRTPHLARARGAVLLQRIMCSLEQAATGKAVKGAIGSPGSALAVISGHDTNLSNVSGMLGLSWLLTSYQADDVPPGGALVFSLWRNTGGAYAVRLQFVAQTLDQMREAKPLSVASPPAIADVFAPGCGTVQQGFLCGWQDFRRSVTGALDGRAPAVQ